mmetsp:Transcript_67977/g.199653  ORF Transcript_67977/g.199653 Transcript_67977/m.199653 type:complete len:148 (-) Transcript_67977:301-744(-)
MAISIVPYIGLACFAAQYLYPGYESVRLLLSDKPSGIKLTQWIVFWVICVSYAALEQSFLYLLVDYFPLYLELKALAFLWLVHPDYLGATWLWHSKLKAIHAEYDKEHYGKLMQVLGALGKAAPVAAEEPRKESVVSEEDLAAMLKK